MAKLKDWQRAALEDLRIKALGKQIMPDRDVWAAILTLTNAMMAMADENHPTTTRSPTMVMAKDKHPTTTRLPTA